MKSTLTFDVSIKAPRKVVWEVMQAPESFSIWTAPFAEGSRYEGSWEQGETIKFLAPDGNGMIGVIKGIQLHELISIEHQGVIENGVEDRSVSWAPMYEDYRLMDEGDGTALQVNVDTLDENESFLAEAFPKALLELRRLCEER
jgi:hypothetical protein